MILLLRQKSTDFAQCFSMLYTGKGDNGTSKIFTSKSGERLSKSSAVFEALGSLDEINSFLGLCKVASGKQNFSLSGFGSFESIVHQIQQDLFIIQAEVAGSEMSMTAEKVLWLEDVTNACEKELPPITTFFISGGTELGALFDTARTIARRAERRIVAVFEEGIVSVSPETKSYLNRLSSALYALARLSNHFSGITEEPPTYT